MRTMHFPQAWRLLLLTWLALLAMASSPLAHAQEDPPGRVGRIADLGGDVSWFDAEQGQWTPAERNRPLTDGDRISTARDGRAELRIGSTTLRLANASELEVLRLDDARIAVQLHSGSLAVRVRAREVADEIELITDEARLLPLRAGLYRIDRNGDSTQAGTWRGEMRVDGPQGLVVAAGQRVDLLRSDRPGALPVWGSMPNDGFSAWVVAEEPGDERTVATRYVSPEMTGAEDLDRNGRWEQHPEYGAVWTPLQVQPDWAPYRYGRWAWVQPWGWTWVDDAPWGFAPFHYGRWAFWRERWCWVPGAYVPRPVFAPALVGWVGGGRGGAGWNLSVRVGGPPVGWVPLAPREAYQPAYRSTPVYLQRVNPPPPYRWQHPPGQRPPGPAFFANQEVHNGITVVAPDVLARRQPVARALINPGAEWRGPGGDSRPPEGPRGERPGMVGSRPDARSAPSSGDRPDGRWDGRRTDRGGDGPGWAGPRPTPGGNSPQPVIASQQPAAAPVVPAMPSVPSVPAMPSPNAGPAWPRSRPLPPELSAPTPQPRVDTRPVPQPQAPQPAEAMPRPTPERQPQRPWRSERPGNEERERPQREGGRASPSPIPATPSPVATPASPTPAVTTGPAVQQPLRPPPPAAMPAAATPAQRPAERPREPRDAREERNRTEGEQRARRADGLGPGREREGGH